ncbi:MAG: ATPase [Hyphomicrobium sp.]|nr:ATPase [Hyphomicrobium sp.]
MSPPDRDTPEQKPVSGAASVGPLGIKPLDISTGGPKGPITDTMMKPLAKRFYKAVAVGAAAPPDSGYQILLDGRAVKTPAKRPLQVPTLPLAEAIAAEWSAQTDTISPATMPLTRFANTAIDAVADTRDAVAADIAAYAGSDLLCYRAETPAELARLQSERWDPIIAWAHEALKVQFTVVTGVMPVAQPAAALAAFGSALHPHEPFRLTALHVMTTLTGSGLLVLAHARDFLSAHDVWTAAHVDEDYQISLWGCDAQAADRRVGRHAEFMAASTFLTLVH